MQIQDKITNTVPVFEVSETLKDVIENGFEFTIIPDWVAQSFGADLPDLAQSSLNAEQAAYANKMAELEAQWRLELEMERKRLLG